MYRICFFFKILFDLIAKIFKPEEILGDYSSIKQGHGNLPNGLSNTRM